ncbi:uncharacterized protein Z519_10772 [Cladophialophora bantiana CBS 173.52]|uniref:Uncharacterized protein n=1 Tax=Cladophialophora bantiana (strain ATCC 10958 / CBS 173.52 / CDC B-1940 / NIH 8579) TaxID=1442370 RepID=A0A0D2EF61_CLAB1|nr:uncharacterized protein Z519_10772 [Cladophialophora bantiana CBS 173.52]KIW88726.1 hypothetical protein Z519_10772 [Cladophialophora bantiana CBS 173.52]
MADEESPVPVTSQLLRDQKPDFVSVLSHIAPFEHGLRRAGVLNKYDYARLRMTCKTTAELLKPYPYNPRRQDTKDPYFAGLRVITCDQWFSEHRRYLCLWEVHLHLLRLLSPPEVEPVEDI